MVTFGQDKLILTTKVVKKQRYQIKKLEQQTITFEIKSYQYIKYLISVWIKLFL
jgi:hypothetical protein